MLLFLKWMIFISSIYLGFLVLKTAWHGRLCAPLYGSYKDAHVVIHAKGGKRAFWVGLIVVFLIEGVIRYYGADGGPLLWAHLFFAVPFYFLLGILCFWQTGIANPKWHWAIAYVCLAFMVGTLITGWTVLICCL